MRRTLVCPRPGFSIIELMMVLGIVAVVGLITFPFLRKMNQFTRVDTGANSVAVAVAAARPYAFRPIPSGSGGPTNVEVPPAGVALIFGPSGEIRICQHDRGAPSTEYVSSTRLYLGAYPENGATTTGVLSPQLSSLGRLSGFSDITDLDWVQLGRGVGVVGVVRNGANSDDLLLFTAPFAIRFDANGQQLVPLSSSAAAGFGAGPNWASQQVVEGYVFYDANGDVADLDGTPNGAFGYETRTTIAGSWRGNPSDGATYNPTRYEQAWKPAYTGTGDAYNLANGRPRLPFERIETVASVLVFSTNALMSTTKNGQSLTLASDNSSPYQLNSDAREWLLESDASGRLRNARLVTFSRNTGTVVREALR